MNTKKLKTFIQNNFPEPNKYDITSEENDKAVILLDYGKAEPKMEITVEKTYDAYNLLKLTDTKLIYNK